jgi:hypothetical protein
VKMQLNSQLWITDAKHAAATRALQVLSPGVEHNYRNKVWKQVSFHSVFMHNHFVSKTQ